MEDIAFSDWPGQPVDFSSNGGNSWLPAYGYQPPSALLERDDFLGNPDAEYFFHGSSGSYMYLETIQEETSDDLRSESDFSSRNSPAGWLATDSETGSVICIDLIDDAESCESDREIACPAKRRRQDGNYLTIPLQPEDEISISRSSSLLQFETLERQCQETSSSSPSLFSNFSFDSLDHRKSGNFSPDSLDRIQSDSEHEFEYYRTLTIDVPRKKSAKSVKGKFAVEKTPSGSESSSSGSDNTLNAPSFDNLKTWRSYDSLPTNYDRNNKSKDKISVENLSEDSGYSDHLIGNGCKIRSNSLHKLDKVGVETRQNRDGDMVKNSHESRSRRKSNKNSLVEFNAYDGNLDITHNFASNFGASYHDLRIFEKYETEGLNFLTRKKSATAVPSDVTKIINIEKSAVCARSKYNFESASEPSLPLSCAESERADKRAKLFRSRSCKNSLFDNSFCVSSVPKDLNLIGSSSDDIWSTPPESTPSIAEKNFDLTDLTPAPSDDTLSDDFLKQVILKTELLEVQIEPRSLPSLKSLNMSSFRREGSYAEAMTNRVDLSDDENSLLNRHKRPASTCIEKFDKKVLNAISESSVNSLHSSRPDLGISEEVLEALASCSGNGSNKPSSRSIAKSTPNLNSYQIEPGCSGASGGGSVRRTKRNMYESNFSHGNRSTSNSGLSDFEDKTITSFGGSISSKGVHFSPVLNEVWHDTDNSTPTPERESSFSLTSTPERERSITPDSGKIIRPTPLMPGEMVSVSKSQPELSSDMELARQFAVSLNELCKDLSKSQPEVTNYMAKRRGSQVIKKDKDGCIIKAYMDADGIQYKHSHLELDNVYKTPTSSTNTNTSGSHVVRDPRRDSGLLALAPQAPLSVSEGAYGGMDTQRKRAGKIGGFFHRLASFRFPLKKSSNEKTNNKKSQENCVRVTSQAQRIATKDDYIYIPLKGPECVDSSSSRNGETVRGGRNEPGGGGYNHTTATRESYDNADCDSRRGGRSFKHSDSGAFVVSGKPPLPRVVGASVKGGGGGGGSGRTERRRTIDQPMEHPMGLIETDLDTEVTVITGGGKQAKTRSLLDLGGAKATGVAGGAGAADAGQQQCRPHKSMEFLLDKQNLKVVEPPENELQKGERVMSEHQLRVERSLQKLTIPDWYKTHSIPKEGFILKKTPRESKWTGTGSKTTSLSSLGSCTQSPLILSPTPHSQPFVRWSTSKLNSTASSPCASTRSSFNTRANGSISPSSLRSSFSYRQPYLGWRSQERLSRPRTPAERLASSLLTHPPPSHPQESPEIQTSIKEVTSAIVHYVSGLRPEDSRGYESQETASQRSSSVSPRGSQKLCWLESSFVGTRPLDSPQTPVTLSESQSSTPVPPVSLRLDLHTPNADVSLLNTARSEKPSPSSTTLEDVLDSLLGLPSSTRAPSPSLQGTVSASTSPSHLSKQARAAEQFRRRSEGSDPPQPASSTRRVSFHSSPVLRCRYSRCGKTAFAASPEGLGYKSCHNCSYTYCSRSCRRAHWEKHRKTCLFSRIGSLCRQVIASTKEQKDTLLHLSHVARRGYLSHGQGAVKCFFPCPEAADKFLSEGLGCLGELTYIRWQDLLPSEMGPQLYAELVKMCKNYNPDSKLVLYISICVISETPATGDVKWERQLVSRCAKMRLSKELRVKEKEQENIETLILTSEPPRDLGREAIKRLREKSVGNVQKQLHQMGVSLRKNHPDVYQQLTRWMESVDDRFIPVSVCPSVSAGGLTRGFLCIIMLEADLESRRQVEAAGVRVKTIDVLAGD